MLDKFLNKIFYHFLWTFKQNYIKAGKISAEVLEFVILGYINIKLLLVTLQNTKL